MYSKWGSNEIGQKCIHQNINLNLHIRPWNALLGHWPYNTIFLGQKCTLLVLRFLFIKKKFHYTIKHSLYINSKKYIFKKKPRKKQEFKQEFKKNPDKCIYILIWRIYLFIMCHFLFTLNSLIIKWKKKKQRKKVHLGLPYNDMNKNGLINLFF